MAHFKFLKGSYPWPQPDTVSHVLHTCDHVGQSFQHLPYMTGCHNVIYFLGNVTVLKRAKYHSSQRKLKTQIKDLIKDLIYKTLNWSSYLLLNLSKLKWTRETRWWQNYC